MYNNERIIQRDLENHDEALDKMVKIYAGQYDELFEEAEKLLGRMPEISDYHDLYAWCLNRITYNLCQNIDLAAKGYSNTSYNKEMLRYKELKKNLDKTFIKFTGITINQKMLDKLDVMEKMLNEQKNGKEILPELESLKKLTEGKNPVLRRWSYGKYKCISLREFIEAYNKIALNITPALIRDYLISEKTGKQYSKETIEKNMALYNVR